MHTLFSLPYTEGIIDLITPDIINQINDIYFSDGKYRSVRHDHFTDDNLQELYSIREKYGIKIQYVMNSAWYSNGFYTLENIEEIIETIKSLDIDILTINNTFLMQNDFFREALKDIEIKNSINNKITTPQQAKFFVERLGFDSIIIDRSLNRNWDDLTILTDYCKENNIKTTLLANEGCIPNCPYKQFCDMKISQAPDGDNVGDKYTPGCYNDFDEFNELIFESPFILPTSINKYKDMVNVIKLAGRYQAIDNVKGIIDAYIRGNGNVSVAKLLNTYTPHQYEFITSYLLEEHNFSLKTINCKNECGINCDFCEKLIHSLKVNYR